MCAFICTCPCTKISAQVCVRKILVPKKTPAPLKKNEVKSRNATNTSPVVTLSTTDCGPCDFPTERCVYSSHDVFLRESQIATSQLSPYFTYFFLQK